MLFFDHALLQKGGHAGHKLLKRDLSILIGINFLHDILPELLVFFSSLGVKRVLELFNSNSSTVVLVDYLESLFEGFLVNQSGFIHSCCDELLIVDNPVIVSVQRFY